MAKIHYLKQNNILPICGVKNYNDVTNVMSEVTCLKCKNKLDYIGTQKTNPMDWIKRRS